jgi:hypothetical protein
MISMSIWIVVNIRFFVSNCLVVMDINLVLGYSWNFMGYIWYIYEC